MREDKKVTIILVNREILNFAKKIKQSGQCVEPTFNSILLDGLMKIAKMSKQDVWKINDEINAKYHKSNTHVNIDDEINSKTLSRYDIGAWNSTKSMLLKEAKRKKITMEKLAFIAFLQIKNYDQYVTSKKSKKKFLEPHKNEIQELVNQNPNTSIYQLWRLANLPISYITFFKFIKSL